MPTLDPRLTNLFNFDNFYTGGAPGTSAGTLSEETLLTDAINATFANSNFFNFYSELQNTTPVGPAGDHSLHVEIASGSANAFYAPVGATLPGATVATDHNVLAFTSDILTPGVAFPTVTDSTYIESVAGVFIHEITHVRLTPVTFPGNYVEEPVIFLTNYWTNAIFGATSERVGHNLPTGTDIPSDSAIKYLNGLELTGLTTPESAYDETRFLFTNASGDKVTKTYYGENYNGFDHVITILGEKASGVLTSGGFLADTRLADIVSGSAVEDVAAKLSFLNATKEAIAATISGFHSLETGSVHWGWLDNFENSLPKFDPKGLLALSDEHFLGDGGLDVQGPVNSGSLNDTALGAAASLLILEGGSQSELIFGSSGYTDTPVSGGRSLALGASQDILLGGSGNDILFLGDGHPLDGRNVADGGLGADILVGAITDPNAHGTLIAGTDQAATIFISGAGQDYLVGHSSPADLVSYAGSDSGVTIDLSAATSITYDDASGASHTVDAYQGSRGDAQGDRYSNIDVFLGSSSSDTFIGSSSGDNATFIGNGGDDIFQLHSNDVAYGGAGNDDFYLNTDDGNDNFWLYGLDPSDAIYINGQQYTGRTLVMARTVLDTASDGNPIYGYETISDTGSQYQDWIYRAHEESVEGPASGFAYISLQATPQSHITIFISGWDEGDASLHYALDYPTWDGPDYGVNGFITSNMDDPGSWYSGSYVSGGQESYWMGIEGFPETIV